MCSVNLYNDFQWSFLYWLIISNWLDHKKIALFLHQLDNKFGAYLWFNCLYQTYSLKINDKEAVINKYDVKYFIHGWPIHIAICRQNKISVILEYKMIFTANEV